MNSAGSVDSGAILIVGILIVFCHFLSALARYYLPQLLEDTKKAYNSDGKFDGYDITAATFNLHNP
jgi:hypothetical protein